MSNKKDVYPEEALNEAHLRIKEIMEEIMNKDSSIVSAKGAVAFYITVCFQLCAHLFCFIAEVIGISPDMARNDFIDRLKQIQFLENKSH